MELPSEVYYSFKISNALLSIDSNVRHITRPSLPVTLGILNKVLPPQWTNHRSSFYSDVPQIKFVRQSNFVAPTSISFDPRHQLTCGDVLVHRSSLSIVHKRSKTHQSSQHLHVTTAPAIPGSILFPQRAFLMPAST